MFQGTYRSNYYNCGWFKACFTALDVKEFLCAKVSAEASLCYGVIAKLQSHLSSDNGVTAMSDVSEWSAVDECRRMLQSLNQVWFQGIL